MCVLKCPVKFSKVRQCLPAPDAMLTKPRLMMMMINERIKRSGLSNALNDIEAVAYSFSILCRFNECRLKSFFKVDV